MSILDRLRWRDLITQRQLLVASIYEMERVAGRGRFRVGIALAWRKLTSFVRRPPVPALILLAVALSLAWIVPPRVDLCTIQVPLALPLPDTYLRILWEVQASLLALTLAVTVFAYQVVLSSGSGLRLDEFERTTGFLRAFTVGIVSLIVNGAVVAGFGRGAPGGFPATEVVALALASLVYLAILVNRSRLAVNPDALLAGRRASLLQEAKDARFYAKLKQKMEEVFVGYRTEIGADGAYGSYVAGAEHPGRVLSPALGYVVDVDLRLGRRRRLRSRARDGGDGDAAPLVLAFVPGQKVDQKDILFAWKVSASDRRRLTSDAVTVEPTPLSGTLGREAERWRALADRALLDNDLGIFDEVIDGFEEALIISTPSDPEGSDGVDHDEARDVLSSQLRLALTAAASDGAEQMAKSAGATAPRIALRAYRVHGEGLCHTMLRMVPGIYEAASSNNIRRARDLSRQRLDTGMISFGEEPASRLEDRNLDADTRRRSARFLSVGFPAFCELAKVQLEAADAGNLKDLVNSWVQLFVYHPDDYLDEEPGRTQGTSDGEEGDEVLAEIARLIRMRQVATFALAGWALELSRRAVDPTEYRECLEYLLALDDQPHRTLNTCNRCLNHEFNEQLDYDDWSSRDAANLEVVVTVPSNAHIRTLLAMLTYRTAKSPVGFTLPPTEWLSRQGGNLARAADELKASGYLAAAMGQYPDRAGDTIDALVERLRKAGRAGLAEKQRRSRETPLDGQRVARLKRDCRAGWESQRVLPPLFDHFGAYELVDKGQVRDGSLKRSVPLPRDLLLKDSNTPLGEEEGRRYGRSLGERATQVFWDTLEATLPKEGLARRIGRVLRPGRDPGAGDASPRTGRPDVTSLRDRIDGAIVKMREKGYRPSVILLAPQLSLGVELDDTGEATERLGVARDPGRSGYAEGEALGEASGVPVLVMMGPKGGEDFCCVIDLDRLGKWSQAIMDDGNNPLGLSLSDTPPTDTPTRTTGQSSVPLSRARDGTAMVYLELEEKFSLKIRDKKAVSWVVAPRRVEVPIRG